MTKCKVFLLVLTSLAFCFFAVGCSDSVGADDYNWEPEISVSLEFDLYIITDSVESEESLSAMKTVNSKINQYLDDKYGTIVNIHYVLEDNYDETVRNLASNPDLTKDKNPTSSARQHGGSIILINGEELHNDLVSEGKLVDLKPFLDSKSFGSLNIQLTSSLIEAAHVSDSEGSYLYCIPNDHPIGQYEFTLIDRSIAEGILNFSAQTELKEMHIVNGVPNESAEELLAMIIANLDLIGVSSVDEVIRSEVGDYADKAYYEANGYICNVTKYPEATAKEAFSSAFGILQAADIYQNGKLLISSADCEERAMEIIYAINADKTVRNLLQYGVEHTHYTLDENGCVVPSNNNAYHMNIKYTGDMFNTLFSSTWTHEMAENGEMQNKDSYVSK